MARNFNSVLSKYHRTKKSNMSIFSGIIIALLIVYCLTLIVLFSWGILASFKEPILEFRSNPNGFPESFYFGNYEYAYSKFFIVVTDNTTGMETSIGMPLMFLYGFLYAIGCAFTATLIPMIVGYMTAKFNFKFSKIIYLIVIITMIIPIVGNLPAEIAMARSLNLFDQIWGMWIMKANFLGIYFIVFYNFFKNLPDAYNEAAKIDGSSNFRTMVQIILPLAAPLFFTVLLINFINFWNDYQVPLIYLPSYPTIAVGMSYMQTSNDDMLQRIPIKLAAAILMLIPTLIVFLAFHKKLLGNLTMGGIKG